MVSFLFSFYVSHRESLNSSDLVEQVDITGWWRIFMYHLATSLGRLRDQAAGKWSLFTLFLRNTGELTWEFLCPISFTEH